MHIGRFRLALGALAALVGGLVVATPTVAADCNATVNAQEMSVEEGENTTRHTFKVDVEAREDCAVIWFDLITEETDRDGETQTRHTSKRVKLHNGSTSMKVNFERPASSRLNSWRVVLASCQLCDSGT